MAQLESLLEYLSPVLSNEVAETHYRVIHGSTKSLGSGYMHAVVPNGTFLPVVRGKTMAVIRQAICTNLTVASSCFSKTSSNGHIWLAIPGCFMVELSQEGLGLKSIWECPNLPRGVVWACYFSCLDGQSKQTAAIGLSLALGEKLPVTSPYLVSQGSSCNEEISPFWRRTPSG